jgi:hypothetical protein
MKMPSALVYQCICDNPEIDDFLATGKFFNQIPMFDEFSEFNFPCINRDVSDPDGENVPIWKLNVSWFEAIFYFKSNVCKSKWISCN